MADFFDYLRRGTGKTDFVKRLDYEVKRARNHKEWRTEYMTLQMKLNEAREEGRIYQLKETLFSFLAMKGTVTADLHKKIEVETNLITLQKWFELAMKADSVEAFMDDIDEGA